MREHGFLGQTRGFMGETPNSRKAFTLGGYYRVTEGARILTGAHRARHPCHGRKKGPHRMASNFQEKFNNFMNHRNGPDQLSRDSLILGIVLLIIGVLLHDAARAIFTILGLAAMAYAYWRMFSSKISDRSRENGAYVAKRAEVLNKLPFGKKGGSAGSGSASQAGSSSAGSSKTSAFKQAAQKAAAQAKAQAADKDHKYFFCPKCGQSVRVPKGAGKIRVKCPKCGEKFERKA